MIKLLTLSLLLISPISIACKCNGIDIGYLLAKSHKAYLGTVSHSSILGDGSRRAATITVKETFKGDTFKVEEVTTDNSSCGVSFTINDTYLVFENDDGFVYQCSMSNSSTYDRHGDFVSELSYLPYKNNHRGNLGEFHNVYQQSKSFIKKSINHCLSNGVNCI